MALYTASHRKFSWYGKINPPTDKYEGQRPNIKATPAPWLPLQYHKDWDDDYWVLSVGKLVAFDSNGYLVPAGIALDLAEYNDSATATLAYSQYDVDQEVILPDGSGYVAASGTELAPLLVAAGITVSNPVGYAAASFYRNSSENIRSLGSAEHQYDVVVPSRRRRHNYARQGVTPICRRYVGEYSVVTTYDPYWGGIAAFDATNGAPTPGDYVTFDMNSNPTKATLTGGSATPWYQVVGQVLRTDKHFPKAYLDYVRTMFGTGTGGGTGTEFNELDAMSGSATSGLPQAMQFAGGSAALGQCQIGFNFR